MSRGVERWVLLRRYEMIQCECESAPCAMTLLSLDLSPACTVQNLTTKVTNGVGNAVRLALLSLCGEKPRDQPAFLQPIYYVSFHNPSIHFRIHFKHRIVLRNQLPFRPHLPFPNRFLSLSHRTISFHSTASRVLRHHSTQVLYASSVRKSPIPPPFGLANDG